MTKRLEQPDVIGNVRDYICGTMLIGMSDQPIESDESLVQLGVVDSTGVLELVVFLQERFGISINDDEITIDNLDTLDSIGAFVQRKLHQLAT